MKSGKNKKQPFQWPEKIDILIPSEQHLRGPHDKDENKRVD